mgnify:CR=1 FL=1
MMKAHILFIVAILLVIAACSPQTENQQQDIAGDEVQGEQPEAGTGDGAEEAAESAAKEMLGDEDDVDIGDMV